MNDIKEGDLVQIIDFGKRYVDYDSWVERNAPVYLKKYRKTILVSSSALFGTVYEVVKIAKHSEAAYWLPLVLLRDNAKQNKNILLFGIDGIIKYNPHLQKGTFCKIIDIEKEQKTSPSVPTIFRYFLVQDNKFQSLNINQKNNVFTIISQPYEGVIILEDNEMQTLHSVNFDNIKPYSIIHELLRI